MASPTNMPVICQDNTKNAYIYGSLSILVISCMSLVGAVIIPCLRNKSRHRWMQVFIALAVATMAGDALLHLIPEALGVHSHGDETDCIKASDPDKLSTAASPDGHNHDGHDHHRRRKSLTTDFNEFDDQPEDLERSLEKRQTNSADYGDDLFGEDPFDLPQAQHDEHEGHDHGEHEDHKMPMIRMSVVFAAVYFFYLFEMIAHGIAEQRKKNKLKLRIKQYTPNGGSPLSRRPKTQVVPQIVPANWGPIYDSPSQYYITDTDSGHSSVNYAYGTVGSNVPLTRNAYPMAPAAARWNYGQHQYHPGMGPVTHSSHNGNVVALSDWWAKTLPPGANPGVTGQAGNGHLPPKKLEERKTDALATSPNGHGTGNGHSHGFDDKTWGDEQPDVCCGFRPIALMILIGDAVHNFADGMAVGVTFAKSNIAGFSTSLAVVCHELPHEIGDFAVLIDTGLPVWKALILNFTSALTAFGGLYVGIVLGETAMRPWLFAVAAGMFLYVAWVDMMHHLKEYKSDDPWYINLALQNVGLVLGFVLIFLIGWFEEDIKI